jgi:hypothetical protein
LIQLKTLIGKPLLVRVTTTYFCAGIVTDAQGIVVDAAPIVRWAMGKHYTRVIDYFKRKNTLEEYWEIEDAPLGTSPPLDAFDAAFVDPELHAPGRDPVRKKGK